MMSDGIIMTLVSVSWIMCPPYSVPASERSASAGADRSGRLSDDGDKHEQGRHA